MASSLIPLIHDAIFAGESSQLETLDSALHHFYLFLEIRLLAFRRVTLFNLYLDFFLSSSSWFNRLFTSSFRGNSAARITFAGCADQTKR